MRPCSSSRAGSPTSSRSAPRRGPIYSPSGSSSRRCFTPASSRRTSAYARTARSRRRSILARLAAELKAARADGIDAVAIVFMHAYAFPEHERRAAALARELGFAPGLGEPRGEPAHQDRAARRYHGCRCLPVADPAPLRGEGIGRACASHARHATTAQGAVHGVVGRLEGRDDVPRARCDPVGAGRRRRRHGRDGKRAGFGQVIGFDMGGTSTDVAHFAGEYERSFET